jgi:type VI secretion system protein ImpC
MLSGEEKVSEVRSAMAKIRGARLGIELAQCAPAATAKPQRAMRMLVLGDFSGRGIDEAPADDPRIGARPIVSVDVDNFDDVLRRFSPRTELRIPDATERVELEVASLEDFHPDALFRRLPWLKQFSDLRERLLGSANLDDAAGDLRALLDRGSVDVERRGLMPTEPPAPIESDDATIERLLGSPATTVSGKRSAPNETGVAVVSELIRGIFGPESGARQTPHRQVYLQALDDALAQRIRTLLHARAFQEMEALWRSAQGLVTGLATDEDLQIHLLDVTLAELSADLALARGDLGSSGLYRLLVEAGGGTPGGEPWSLLVGSFSFGPEVDDLSLLAELGVIASHAGGPFLAAARPALLGCRSFVETPDPSDWRALSDKQTSAWSSLRRSPVAPWLGLVLPRVLLRLPYGKDTDPVEAFDFEELGPERRHEDYLWGNPAFACALLIGRAFEASGWSMRTGDVLDLGDLPAHVYAQGGEKHMQADAEVYLTERAASAILDRGIMPFLSFRRRNLVRLACFQSLAQPAAELAGPWAG